MKENKNEDYAEVIKKMKNEINIDELGIQVKSIVKTKNGNAKIITEENSSESLKKFKQKINDWLGDKGKAVGDSNKSSAIIKDIDITTTREEVEQAIRSILSSDSSSSELKVSNLKLNARGNTQSATVEASRDEIRKLVDLGRINVGGWQTCRLEEFVVPTRCYKCNLYGHRGFECTNEEFDRNKCFKCNQHGHQAAGCTNEAFCQACNKVGHRHGSMMCEIFKKLVLEERGRRKR